MRGIKMDGVYIKLTIKENIKINMLTFFKDEPPKDVKGIRNALLQFIKEQLQKAEGGEGGNIRGMSLYLTCGDNERHQPTQP